MKRLSGVLATIVVFLCAVEAFAVDHWVRRRGSPCRVNHTSIQHAINHANSGDTILVERGIYREQITINKDGLTITSFRGPNQTAIHPPELTSGGVVITGEGNLFEGFTVRDITLGHPHAHRLIFVQGDANVISNCILIGRGPSSYSDGGIVIRGGGVGNGVAEWNVVESCTVQNTVHGILSVSVAPDNAAVGTAIYWNTVQYNSGNGIGIDRSPECMVLENYVALNGTGILVRSREVTQGDWATSAGTIVEGNEVVLNDIGAEFWAAGGVSVGNVESPNTFAANGVGILVAEEPGNTGTPTINYNNIEGNEEYGLVNLAGEQVNAENNWWGDPGGPGADADNDGVYGDAVSGDVDYDPWWDTPL